MGFGRVSQSLFNGNESGSGDSVSDVAVGMFVLSRKRCYGDRILNRINQRLGVN